MHRPMARPKTLHVAYIDLTVSWRLQVLLQLWSVERTHLEWEAKLLTLNSTPSPTKEKSCSSCRELSGGDSSTSRLSVGELSSYHSCSGKFSEL